MEPKTPAEEFETKRYIHVKEFVSSETCTELTKVLRDAAARSGSFDAQCKISKSVRDNPVFDKVLVDLLPYFEVVTGLKLLPTYAYARWYVPGEELKVHLDRPACEISATITLGFEGDVWPIFMGVPSKEKTEVKKTDDEGNEYYSKDVNKISMEVGDAVVYHGCELLHWREPYKEGKWQAQVFLHYVDANGPHAEWKNDKREFLAHESVSNDLVYWAYNDVLSSTDCDGIIEVCSKLDKEKALIHEGIKHGVDESIRNVETVILPTYKGIGAALAAVGFDANQQRWKFTIDRANQCEFLTYPAGGGRYRSHIDTYLINEDFHLRNCRKITILAFLNDDFKGGRFYLQYGSQKFYPPQSKGTIIAFPSFIMHGVEDVEEGTRYSAVCWLVGPWFK